MRKSKGESMKTKKCCKYYEEKNFDIGSAALAEGFFNNPENPCVKNDWYSKVKDKDVCKHCKYRTGDGCITNDDITQSPAINPTDVYTFSIPKYTAEIKIGSWIIQLMNKTFTNEQIKNMREMLGWEVRNL